jgi:hypothetical protein
VALGSLGFIDPFDIPVNLLDTVFQPFDLRALERSLHGFNQRDRIVSDIGEIGPEVQGKSFTLLVAAKYRFFLLAQ